MNISSSLSSIQAHETLMNNSAHNIANANTKNFDRVDTQILEKSLNGTQAVSSQIDNPNIYSGTNLTKEITNQILSYHAIGANSVALKTQDEVAGTILDIKA